MSEITINATGFARGTKVYVDGEEINKIYEIGITIAVDEPTKICIKKYATNKDGKTIFNPDTEDLLREELWFQGGEINIKGAVSKLAAEGGPGGISEGARP